MQIYIGTPAGKVFYVYETQTDKTLQNQYLELAHRSTGNRQLAYILTELKINIPAHPEYNQVEAITCD